MRKEYYNYVVKLPVLLHELFRGKVADYHFSDMTVVMNHLVKSTSHDRMVVGQGHPSAHPPCMDRIPDMSFFFRRQEKSVLFFEMDPAVAGAAPAACHHRWRLGQPPASCRPPGAPCVGAVPVTLNNLSMELYRRRCSAVLKGYLHTYLREQLPVRVPEGDGRRPAHERGGYADGCRRAAGGGTDDDGAGYHIPRVRPYR